MDIFSNSYLERCSELCQLGLSVEVGPGMLVAHGFADLGYEVFYTLPGEKLLSLFTGNQSELVAGSNGIFPVLEADSALACIDKLGFVLKEIQREDLREWKLNFMNPRSSELVSAKDRSLNIALLEVLKGILVSRGDERV